jgi:hypothetical protein
MPDHEDCQEETYELIDDGFVYPPDDEDEFEDAGEWEDEEGA